MSWAFYVSYFFHSKDVLNQVPQRDANLCDGKLETHLYENRMTSCAAAVKHSPSFHDDCPRVLFSLLVDYDTNSMYHKAMQLVKIFL